MDITFTIIITAVLSFGIAELFGRSKHIGRWWMFGLMVGAFFVPGILAYLASPHASKTPTKPSRLTSQIGIVLTIIGVVGLFPAQFVGPVALSMPLAIVLIGTYLIQLGRGNVVNHAPKEYFRFQGSDYLKNQSKGIGQYFRQAVDELKTNNNMLYYLVEDGKPSEPYSYEQLKSKRIKEDALVWRRGLNDWVKAKELEELFTIIGFNPPPIPIVVDSTQIKPKNGPSKINNNKGIIIVMGVLTAIFIFLIAKEMNNKSNYHQTNETNTETLDTIATNNLYEENLSNNETALKEVLPYENKADAKPDVSLPENYFLSKDEKLVFVFDSENKYWWFKELFDDPRYIMPILTREQMDYIYNSDYETEIGGWYITEFDFFVDELNKSFNKKGKVFRTKNTIDSPLN